MIGAIGDEKLNNIIVFSVSSDKVLTFDNFEQTSSIRTGKHEIHLQKPKTEFLGPDLDTITFTMRFDVALGINPMSEIEKLRLVQRSGSPVSLVIGGKSYGENLWAIKSFRREHRQVDNRGNVLVAEVSIELEEYI